MPKNKWRIAFIALLIIFCFTSIFQIYLLIDASVTISYMKDGYNYLEKDNRKLESLIISLSEKYSRNDILNLLHQQNKAEIISETDSTIEVGDLVFCFNEIGNLIDINEL